MTTKEAERYYRAVVGGLQVTPEELLADERARHILAHNCGVFPEGVDEDVFFQEVLNTMSDNDRLND